MRALFLLIFLVACAREPQVIPVACADPLAGCRLKSGIEIRFSRTPSAMQAFDIEVVAPEAGEIHASFQMRDMGMGMNRYRFLKSQGKWHASVMLPACVQARHDWVLRLELGGGTYEMPFVSG